LEIQAEAASRAAARIEIVSSRAALAETENDALRVEVARSERLVDGFRARCREWILVSAFAGALLETARKKSEAVRAERDASQKKTHRTETFYSNLVSSFAIVLANRTSVAEEETRTACAADVQETRAALERTTRERERLRAELDAARRAVLGLRTFQEDFLKKTRDEKETTRTKVEEKLRASAEAERASRLRVAYARECERRLKIAEADAIRMRRALDARGGEPRLGGGRDPAFYGGANDPTEPPTYINEVS
jgi:hypothetical protein